jgi:D-alanyl-D-alanine dipeptidase
MHDHLFKVLQRPDNIINLQGLMDNLVVDLAYYTTNNFTGCIVDGYKKNIAYLEERAANHLAQAQERFNNDGYSIKVFDAYRPLKAIKFFKFWSENDQLPQMKELFPHLTRSQLFADGYINPTSSHARASAIDFTLVNLKDQSEVDFGTAFDFFGVESHTESSLVPQEQQELRKYLRAIMQENGFRNYYQEWWHYSFIDETYPKTFFDFDVL